ncbi:MAG: LON peptidase substrate-binding domain-containing protein, partial [Planctomycetes bacterium]|nr:LON peptidase substrate-binding domain-containing protein [Planctomycetota bacterium]
MKDKQNQTQKQDSPESTTQLDNSARKEEPTIPEELPVLALKDTVVFPQMVTALGVTAKEELKLLDNVLAGNRFLALALQKDESIKNVKPDDLYLYATGAIVLQMLRMPDGTARMLVQGISRIHFEEFTQVEPYLKAKVKSIEDILDKDVETEALTRNISDQFSRIISMTPNLPEELKIAIVNIDNPGRLADMIASHLNIGTVEKQEILEAINVKERLQKVTALINKEMEVLELATKIQSQVKSEMEKGQREYYLRQQLKAIQEELGEGDERTIEIKELKKKIAEAKLPPEAQKEAERELSRLEVMPPAAAEYTVARTYLDWIVTLPWSITTEDNLD